MQLQQQKIDGVMSTLHPRRINITTDRRAIGKQCLALEEVIAGSVCFWGTYLFLAVFLCQSYDDSASKLLWSPLNHHYLQMKEPPRAFHDAESWGEKTATAEF